MIKTPCGLPRFYMRPEARMGDIGKEPEAGT